MLYKWGNSQYDAQQHDHRMVQIGRCGAFPVSDGDLSRYARERVSALPEESTLKRQATPDQSGCPAAPADHLGIGLVASTSPAHPGDP